MASAESDPSRPRLGRLGDHDVLGRDRGDILGGDGLEILLEKPRRLVHLGLLEDIPNVSAVAEILVGFGNIKRLFKFIKSVIINLHSVLS